MDKQKVMEWLSKLAANCREKQDLCVLEEGVFEAVNGSRSNAVQLYHCAQKAAETVGVPYEVSVVKYADGENNQKVSFTYDGVEFFSLEEYVNEKSES